MKTRWRIDYNAPFCLTFALLALAAYASAVFTGGWTTAHVFSIPGAASFLDWTTYPRLLLHTLGHVSAEHLGSNLMLLLLVGPMLEKIHGPRLLALLSGVTAAVTGLAMVLLFPGNLAGASGIVFAFIILSSFANAKSGTIPLTFLLVAVIFLGGELYRAVHAADQIAQFAHLLGGAVGGCAGFLMSRR